jgi:hypothetical protein
MAKKTNTIRVQDIEIGIKNFNNQDYICLTHIATGKEGDDNIRNWMRNRNTIEYLGIWESLHNPNFKGVEFDTFKKQSGLNSFNMTPKKWIDNTDAIGIVSISGKNGGTYAHKDIAFNFAMWISPMFQLYITKEYQRLKEIETNTNGLEWNVKRIVSKSNYHIQTDAIKNYIIPKLTYSQKKEWAYAEEADVLNIVLFGMTASQWKQANPQRALLGENLRDSASINELTLLSNLESMNATMIKNNVVKNKRMRILYDMVKVQKPILDKVNVLHSLKKLSDNTYIDYIEENKLSDFDQKLKKGLGFDPNAEK